MTAVKDMSAYSLANLADCGCPDTLDSAGAEFLTRVRDAVVEAYEWTIEHHEPTDLSDMAHEAADGAVPVYTFDLWRTFVDVAAFQEDPTELGFDGADMDQAARLCLYMIAERLASALLAELADGDDSE